MNKKTTVFDRLDNTIGNYMDGAASEQDVVKIAIEINEYLLKNPHPHDSINPKGTPKTTQAFEELCEVRLDEGDDKYHFYYAGELQLASKSKFDCMIAKKALQRELDV